MHFKIVFTADVKERKIAIRYAYHPYCPWRHGYVREKAVRFLRLLAGMTLFLLLLFLCISYLRDEIQDTVNVEVCPDSMDDPEDQTFFGIGYDKENQKFFLFRRNITEITVPEPAR